MSEWYFNVTKGRAERADERGPSDEVLGPYPTREAAENWREQVDARNEEWDADDARWEGDDEPGSD